MHPAFFTLTTRPGAANGEKPAVGWAARSDEVRACAARSAPKVAAAAATVAAAPRKVRRDVPPDTAEEFPSSSSYATIGPPPGLSIQNGVPRQRARGQARAETSGGRVCAPPLEHVADGGEEGPRQRALRAAPGRLDHLAMIDLH